MFDRVYCHQQLPDIIIEGKIVKFPDDTQFQTKDFDCLFDIYHIDIHNRLLRKEAIWAVETPEYNDSPFEGPFEIVNYHGIFTIYSIYETDNNKYWINFRIKYTDGLLVSIDQKVEKITL